MSPKPTQQCLGHRVLLGIFHPSKKVLMPVSPCETLINLRGRRLEGELPWPHKAEDDGSVYVVRRNAADIPASNKNHMAFPASPLEKREKKCSPLRKESSCVLYAWREIKTGVPRWRTVGLLCLLHDHRQWQGPAVTLLATGSSENRVGPSGRPLAAKEKSLSPSTWAGSKLPGCL